MERSEDQQGEIWPSGSFDVVERIRSAHDGQRPAPRPNKLMAAMCGIAVAAIAIFLRLTVSAATAGEQAIFSFPAIVAATLLFGVRAGAVAAVICLAAFWYFVLPPVHSARLSGPSEVISVLVYLFVAGALIWAIGAMRLALARYRGLTDELGDQVERRTAERNRVWERSQEMVAIVTPAGAIDAVNPSLRSKLAIDLAPRTSFSSIIVEEDWPTLDAAYDKLAVGISAVVFQARMRGAEGVAWVEWSAVLDGHCTYMVGRDFTAERDCAQRLLQSQKMEFVGQMTGGLVHDFANLLSPMTMTLDLLQQRHGGDERTTGLIASARESTTRAQMLVKRLLKFARAEKLDPKLISVRVLVEQIAPLLRQVVGRRVLDIVLGDDLRDIRVDPNEFDMALLNLVVNARDATTAAAGHVRLSVENIDAGLMAITVADDGEGMDAETLNHAHEPFFSTKGPERGTGLGLPMVHHFAVKAGGSLRLESEPGKGTVVRIYLPAMPSR